MNAGAEDDWLTWCEGHREWLATEFLRALGKGGSVHTFFGSWYDVQGRNQTGYYLGHELIRELESGLDMREIALLDGDDPRLRASIQRLSEG
jgi:hypothetical protein